MKVSSLCVPAAELVCDSRCRCMGPAAGNVWCKDKLCKFGCTVLTSWSLWRRAVQKGMP